jgi:hypothetical protein
MMKQHQSLMQRCIDTRLTESNRRRPISSHRPSYTIFSKPTIVLVILCFPVVFLLSRRYLESSTQRQPNKETRKTSSFPLRPDDLRPSLETIVRRVFIHHSIPQTPTLPRTRYGTWRTIQQHTFTLVTQHHPKLGEQKALSSILGDLPIHYCSKSIIRQTQTTSHHRKSCDPAVPAAQPLAPAAAANAVAMALAAHVVPSMAFGVLGIGSRRALSKFVRGKADQRELQSQRRRNAFICK